MEFGKSKLKSGFKWSAIERVATQISQLLILLVLSRLLGPKTYGLIGMLTIFIAVAQTLVDSGFTSSLVRRKKISQEQYSTIFWFNLGISILLYLLIYSVSDFVAYFYKTPELSDILKIMSLIIIINALCIIHKVKLLVAMDFKTQAVISGISVVISGVGSITFALNGGGVWALVLNSILFSITSTIIFFFKMKWYPSLVFNYRFFKVSFSFSYKLALASLLNTFFDNCYQLVIARFYSIIQVGYFVQAKNLTLLPTNTYSAIVQRVTYRYFSEIKNNKELLKEKYISTIKYTAVIFFPLMISLAFYSKEVIIILMGDQWLPAAEYLSIMALCFCFYPVHAVSLNILNVFGRSDLFLKLEFIKKILMSIFLVLSLSRGINAICWGMVVYSIIATYINSIYISNFLSTSVLELIKTILPIIIISIISAFISYMMVYTFDCTYFKIIGAAFSLIIYVMIFYVYERKTVVFLFKAMGK